MDLTFKLKENRLLPVSVFERMDDALRAADILMSRGLDILEITMRTKTSAACIEGLSKKIPELTLGAGSIDSVSTLKIAADSGASFAVSAGFDAEIVSAASEAGIPFVPGAATPSELMGALKYSKIVKIFPAALLGGVAYINAIKAPFALKEFHLLPTGGIDETNFMDYLSVEKVIACGMSRIVDPKLIAAGDYAGLEKRIDDVLLRLQAL